MPSFDVVSEVDLHELTNAVDQAARELSTRYDFRDVDASYEHNKTDIELTASADFQVKQMLEILHMKLTRCGIDINCLEEKKSYASGKQTKQLLTVKQGLDKEMTKKIIKAVKEAKLKVQSAVHGEKVRITGKKRDDLQSAIALMKEEDFGLPLQFENFRD